MNIYNFNTDLNRINNLNEGEYTNQILGNIENNIAKSLNIDINNEKTYVNKEIKF